jgi:UDP-2,3-diacylglucosamine pyrophosphatase LpxH
MLRVRTLFLSDIHLGFKRARARELAEFLQGIEAENILLVGDIVDALSLTHRPYWSEQHTRVARALLAKRRAGSRLIYIPGNHDANFGLFSEVLHGQVEVHREWVHRTAAGEQLLVLHGDQFDTGVHCERWLHRLGDFMYGVTLGVNEHLNRARRLLGMSYWSVAEHLKLAVGTSKRYIERFETTAVRHATSLGYDGIVCGHIHRARLERIEGALYCNTGDWVDSCSALVEDAAGTLHLLRWPGIELPAPSAPTRLAIGAACGRA